MRPPAALILELAHGAMSTHILGALARLDIAEHLAAGPRGVADLAAVTGTEPELLDRLLRAATVLGLVQRTPGGQSPPRPVRACADPGRSGTSPLMLPPGTAAPAGTADRGAAADLPSWHGQPIWDYYRDASGSRCRVRRRDDGVSATIAGQVAEQRTSECRRIVDVGGGHGTLLRALPRHRAQAQACVSTCLRWSASPRSRAHRGFAAGDFMTSVPGLRRRVRLSHVLHDWDDDAARRILAACRRAAPAHARLLIVEAVLADEPGPLTPEILSLHVLVMGGGGERRRDQFRQLLHSAGWQLGEVTPLPSGQSILTARPS
jgi:DNA-binding HxlR family transcriptional regulator